MTSKRAIESGETNGFCKTSDNFDIKSILLPSQEKQQVFSFEELQNQKPKSLNIVQCYECKREVELDGYRFRFVPVCKCCRTEREIEITRNRFERRNKR